MYFVFKSAILGWHNQEQQAMIQGEAPPPHIQNKWWESEVLTVPLSDLTFAINQRAPLLDNYFTGLLLDLYSIRLIDLLQRAEINFETFPVKIVDQKTKQRLKADYRLFHLLEMYPGLDTDPASIDSKVEIHRLPLTQECLQSQRPMFRLKEWPPVVLIHQKLKAVLELAGITGCQFIHVDEFRFGMRMYSEKLAAERRKRK